MYRRGNILQSTSQIITKYIQYHMFIMKDLTILPCTQETGDPTASVGNRSKDVEMYLRLQWKIAYGTACNLGDLERVAGVCDITLATITFLRQEIGDDIDEPKLLSWKVQRYEAFEIAVPKFYNEDLVIHNIKGTALKEFRARRRRSDSILISIHRASERVPPGALNGRMPARQNAVYKIKEM